MEHSVYTIGIDEVGRGPLAGPLVVCACAIRSEVNVLALFPKGQLRDSKKVSEKVRVSIVVQLSPLIEKRDVLFGIGEVSAEKIDVQGLSLSIKEAIELALQELHGCGVSEDSYIFLDGSLYADKCYQQITIIKGDEKIPEIALASIIAKCHRDAYMKNLGRIYPLYGFENHVGYGTYAHYEAIKEHGLTPIHRRSFLKKVLLNE